MNHLEIKKITKNDYEFLYVLMNNSSIMKALNEVSTSIEDWKNAMMHWENDEDEENYIIYSNDTPIGWISINNLISSDQEAFIKILAILPESQKNGIGAYAVKYITDYLTNKGFKKISLYTDKENINAQKCYTKCGFKVQQILIDTMSNGNTVERYKMSSNLYKV